MSKLIYPANGLHGRCKGKTSSCFEKLSGAIANCTFSIPSDFPHKNYLDGLSGTLNQYRQEIKLIDTKIQNMDKSFSNLSDSLLSDAGKIAPSKINKRDRLIV